MNVLYSWISIIFLFLFLGGWIVGYALDEIYEEANKKVKMVLIILSSLLATYLILIFIATISISLKEYKTDESPYLTQQIVSLGDDDKLSGRMNGGVFASSGYINETMYYQYMVKQSDGGCVYDKIKAEYCKIYYTNDKNYRVERYSKHKSFLFYEERTLTVKIYIPKGSIVEEFKLDLK